MKTLGFSAVCIGCGHAIFPSEPAIVVSRINGDGSRDDTFRHPDCSGKPDLVRIDLGSLYADGRLEEGRDEGPGDC